MDSQLQCPSPPVKPRTKPRPAPRSTQSGKDPIGDLIVKSDPYTIEEFAKNFQLTQTVRVYASHYGITAQLSMSEGESLYFSLLSLQKLSKQQHTISHLPLNSLLQFSPYDQASTANSTDDGTAFHQPTTMRDLIVTEKRRATKSNESAQVSFWHIAGVIGDGR